MPVRVEASQYSWPYLGGTRIGKRCEILAMREVGLSWVELLLEVDCQLDQGISRAKTGDGKCTIAQRATRFVLLPMMICEAMLDDDCFYYHPWRNSIAVAFGTFSSLLTRFNIVSGVVCVVCPFCKWWLGKNKNNHVDLAWLVWGPTLLSTHPPLPP